MLYRYKTYFIYTLFMLAVSLPALAGQLEFRRLQTSRGLSNTQVNAIIRDQTGYMWFGTQSGLDRYDGFRFHNYFYENDDTTSLSNNSVDELQLDADGNLWVLTGVGYCVMNTITEKFDRHPERMLKAKGIDGTPQRVFIDSQKNMWVIVADKACYFHNPRTGVTRMFAMGRSGATGIPKGYVSCISESAGRAVLTYDDGTLVGLNGPKGKVAWRNDYLRKLIKRSEMNISTFIDAWHNYWVTYDQGTCVYSPARKQWYSKATDYLRAVGYSIAADHLLIKDIRQDSHQRLWIATDHQGLFLVDPATKQVDHYMYDRATPGSLPDNTLQHIYLDPSGGAWIGTYKNGLAYTSGTQTLFTTIGVGDVCSIAEDRNGLLWCATNEDGIACYNPANGHIARYHSSTTGLGSEVVVSSLAASDGSIYFGSFNGGLARYKDGRWTTWRATHEAGGLASDNIWSLAETADGVVVIGTLGGGVQLLDPATGRMTTYNQKNSRLASDYISSVTIMDNGNILISHYHNFSVMDARTHRITSYSKTIDGKPFISPNINMAIRDSRGIYWMATLSGMSMYAPDCHQLESINEINGTRGSVGCAVVEDEDHNIWLVSDHHVTRAVVKKGDDGQWDFLLTSYNSLDGLQARQLNYRAAMLTHDGKVVVGGQDGLNIIPARKSKPTYRHSNVVFAGVVMFDNALRVGDKFNGRVVLDEAINRSRRLDLQYDENTFTIQLATDHVAVPARQRFLYRVEGVTNKWMLAPEEQPNVTFTNLAPGTYELQVKVMGDDNTGENEISTLTIVVHPPLLLSWGALVCYLLLFVGVAWWWRSRSLRLQRERFKAQQHEEEVKHQRYLDEIKLNFFTNVSHELRTPLTLIISPIDAMLRSSLPDDMRSRLTLVKRNADNLLAMVNQILDFRRMENHVQQLDATMGDVVKFTHDLTESFRVLSGRGIRLSFHSTITTLNMLYDAPKLGKVINNLLSNAYKFTPDGGSVDVRLTVVHHETAQPRQADELHISVADTGRGIADSNKERIFERFFQENASEMQPFGGSGIGLHLAKTFVELHGGRILVADNEDGGTIFTVVLPIDFDVSTPTSAVSPKAEEQADDGIDATDTVAQLPPAAPQQEQQADDKEQMEDRKQLPTVMLVDDSDDFREFMTDILSPKYHVVEAINGQQALNLMAQHQPDIILSDVMMPVMDGNELCKRVKADKRWAAIPFVMLTARLSKEQKIESLTNGADDYITKPFDVDLLAARIDNLLLACRNRGSANHSGATASTDITSAQEAIEAQQPQLSTADRRLLDHATDYVIEHMSDPNISVETLSDHVGMSRVQLYKRLLAITGSTPSEFIRLLRIKHAAKLLDEGDYNVSEIAYKVGFNNPRYFTKHFSDYYGVTPSQYRKQGGN